MLVSLLGKRKICLRPTEKARTIKWLIFFSIIYEFFKFIKFEFEILLLDVYYYFNKVEQVGGKNEKTMGKTILYVPYQPDHIVAFIWLFYHFFQISIGSKRPFWSLNHSLRGDEHSALLHFTRTWDKLTFRFSHSPLFTPPQILARSDFSHLNHCHRWIWHVSNGKPLQRIHSP